MLSTITAAEMLFRHESESRAREHAVLASIQERRGAETSLAAAHIAVAARGATAAEQRLPVARATRAVWPRPIGIKDYATTACAAA
ncbi:MAG: hypothetical protein ABWZ16_09030 [Microbacterium sp.]